MKLDSAKLVEVVGVLAVVLSLLFVAFELQQSNRIAIGTAEYELLRDGNTVNQLIIENADLRTVMSKVRLSVSELTPDERAQVITYAFTQYSYWVAVLAAHEQSLVSDTFMSGTIVDVESNVQNTPGMDFAWKILLERGYEANPILEAIEKTLPST